MLIGEVSRRCGVSTRMLRHYDALGLVIPTGRTSGGYREYSDDDIRRLFHVECLRTLGLSLDETRRALDDPDFTPADLVTQLIEHTRARITAEQELLRKLEHVAAAEPGRWDTVMDTVTLLHALGSDSPARRQQAVLAHTDTTTLPVDALVTAALSEDNAYVAGALRWSLARAGNAALPGLATGLRSETPETRRRATAALTAIPTPEATDLLRAALTDEDRIVRERAALALGHRTDPQAIPTLIDMIINGDSDVEAAEVLGTTAADPAHGDTIVHTLRDRLH